MSSILANAREKQSNRINVREYQITSQDQIEGAVYANIPCATIVTSYLLYGHQGLVISSQKAIRTGVADGRMDMDGIAVVEDTDMAYDTTTVTLRAVYPFRFNDE